MECSGVVNKRERERERRSEERGERETKVWGRLTAPLQTGQLRPGSKCRLLSSLTALITSVYG